MIVHAPFPVVGRRILLLADGAFSPVEAKTAACVAMYYPQDVVAVLDRSRAGKRVSDVLGYGGDAPVVATIDEALARAPQVAVVGTAPRGGILDDALADTIAACLRAGVDVASGLHAMVASEPRLAEAAAVGGARIWDVRAVPETRHVSTGIGCQTGATVVLTVGSDCNVGKMTATVEMFRAAGARGVRAAWAATGQTGIILRGRGIAVDRVVSDFVGGAAEALVNAEGDGADVVFVEGQGAITHPGYAGVTLALMYGAMPDALVLVHAADRDRFKRLEFPIPPLPGLIDLYESLMRPYKDCRVAGIALNTYGLSASESRRAVSETEALTRRPTIDVVRSGADRILDAIDGGKE